MHRRKAMARAARSSSSTTTLSASTEEGTPMPQGLLPTQFVATAATIEHRAEYGECSGVTASLSFVATRATLADAEAELDGWVRRNVKSAQGEQDLILAVVQVNEYGDQVQTFI